MRSRRSQLGLFLALLLVAVGLRLAEANPAIAQTQVIGAWRVDQKPILDGSAPEWQSILPIFLPTTSQQTTPPVGGGAVERIGVRAVHFEDRLYVMLEWTDLTADNQSDRHEAFTDAAAVQFPAEAGSEVPTICMGQADRAVNIWQWRADQQSDPPGLPENGYVDSYPSTEDLFFPARQAGNPLSQTENRSPVSNLVAGGFGTLEVSSGSALTGHAVHKGSRWMLVFSRPFQGKAELEPTIDGSSPVDVAFAVWDGSLGERDGIKSVSGFTQIQVTTEDPPLRAVAATDDWPAFSPSNRALPFVSGFIALVIIAGAAIWMFMERQRGQDNAEAP